MLSSQLTGLDFRFRDPEARFDRTRVKAGEPSTYLNPKSSTFNLEF